MGERPGMCEIMREKNDKTFALMTSRPMFLSTSNPSASHVKLLDDVRWRLQGVQANEPSVALDELTSALAAVIEDETWALEDVVEGLAQLDESAQSHIRQAFKAFMQSVALNTGRRDVLHAACMRYFDALGQACTRVLDRSRYTVNAPDALVVEVATRLMRTNAARLKWDHLVYGPYDGAMWHQMGAIYLDAVEASRIETPVRLRLGRDTETSIHQEYLRAVALKCAGLDQLPVELIDVVDRLVRYLLPAMHLGATPVEGARFFVSPMLGSEPRRLIRTGDNYESIWYFSPLMAEQPLAELESLLRKGVVPGGLEGGAGAKERIMATIRHLRRIWYDTPISRRHRRHAMDGRIDAVRGFAALRQALKMGGDVPPSTWDLRDASVSGLGVLAPLADLGIPRIGELVGVRTDSGSEWRLGMIRRIQRDDFNRALLGLETFASAPRIVRADDGRAPVDVLLCDPLHRGGQLRVVAPINVLRAGSALYVAENGVVQKLKPLSAIWRGNEFEVRTYLAL